MLRKTQTEERKEKKKEEREGRGGGNKKNPERCQRGAGIAPARKRILFNLGG